MARGNSTSRILPLDFDWAVEVFARAFAFTRSFTHPYIVERAGPLWVTRDAPRKNGDYRNEEFIAHGLAPADVHRLVQKHVRGRFAISAIHTAEEPAEPIRGGFKSLGYRLLRVEPFMIHRLQQVPQLTAPATIERVRTQEMADRLAAAARSRQVLPEHLDENAPMRQYVALIDDQPVGWVRSIVVGDATWCSNMYIKESFRRRGIGRAMLCRLLRDDRTTGMKACVLTATQTGSKLYAAVGFEQIGSLLLFAPKRS